jgi:NAD(P)-dependent dehydrogenase (short-subunit alcohol dehydrogenase family)
MDLKGKVAIVTGGGTGMGKAVSTLLAASGVNVAVNYSRSEADAVATAEELTAAGVEALPIRADVSVASDVAAMVEQTERQLGRVDILVNNAGIGTAYPATRETPEQFRQVIDVNLNGCYWMAQACGRVMQPGSSIVNISSMLGLTTAGLPQAAYAASKAGLIGLTRDLAQQWTGRKGIRVNALAPGFFTSEMTDAYPDAYIESQMPRVLVGRKGEPEELAAALIFLVSDAGGYVTGTTIPVEGGMLTS